MLRRAEFEQGDIGDVLFRVACNMGLEGIDPVVALAGALGAIKTL
jgi:hypothetical protein